jgi:hypothetical protein
MFFNQLSTAQPCDNGSIWRIVISFGWMALLDCSFDFYFLSTVAFPHNFDV